jgi:hypothetical protein
MWRLAKSDYLKLALILSLAFYLAFIPHANYSYPVHIDEWVHLAHSEAMLGAQDTTYVDPFLGKSTVGITSNLEAGYHLFLGVFHRISGISWPDIFRYFPGIIFMATVLSVYVLARREGFGWEAAFFTSLIPTTVGILGPAFLVPVAMGLIFLPLSLFLAFNFRTLWSYLALFLFTSFLLSIHATTAVGLVIILTPYILLNLKGNFKHSLGMTLALAVPFVALFPWIFGSILSIATGLLTQVFHPSAIALPRVITTYGYLPVSLCLLGIFWLAMRGDRKSWGLALGLLALLLVLVAYFTFNYGVQPLYTRGLMSVKHLRLPARLSTRLRVPLVTQNLGRFFCLVLVTISLVIGIPDRQDTPYYLMIDRQDYESFMWIKDNVGQSHTKAILDPWKATAFAALTQRHTYTRIHTSPHDSDLEAYTFLRGGSTNTTFLEENGISIIYTRVQDGGDNAGYGSDNPDLVELAENIYVLKKS